MNWWENDPIADRQPQKSNFWDRDPVVEKPRTSLPGAGDSDPFYQRAFRTMDDWARATANTATFGLLDRALGEDEQKLSAEARERSPIASFAGDIAGAIAPAGAMSVGLGKAIPALGKVTLPSIAANQAITGAGFSATDDLIRHGEVDVAKAGVTGAISGIAAPAVAAVSRFVSPGSARVRAAGADLTPADRQAAAALANKADWAGMPITAPEVAKAVAPGRAAGVNRAFDRAAGSRGGTQIVENFMDARAPQLAGAAKRVAERAGQPASGLQIQRGAERALGEADDLVRQSSREFYDRAANVVVPRSEVPVDSAAFRTAVRRLGADKIQMQDIAARAGGKAPHRDSILFLDHVKKELDTMYTQASNSGNNNRARLIGETARDLKEAMIRSSDDYAQALDIQTSGRAMLTEPLQAGPLGTMSKTAKPTTQSGAMFDISTPPQLDDTIAAINRMPREARQAAINRLHDATQRAPDNFAKRAFPTDPSLEAGKRAFGSAWDDIADPMEVSRAIRPDLANPQPPGHHTGIAAEFFRHARDIGQPTVAEKLLDPKSLNIAGIMGPVQGAAQVGTTAAAAKAVAESPISGQKRRKKKKDGDGGLIFDLFD